MIRWSIKCTVPPTSEPITVPEFSKHANIFINDDDEWALGAIKAARELAEKAQQRQLMTATWRLTLDQFPSWEIRLPFPPLQSVSSITYVDMAGTTQTLGTSLYQVSTASEPGCITPAYSQIWPTTRDQMDAVTITYVAGYTSAALVPWKTRFAIKALAAELYVNREFNSGIGAAGTNVKPNPALLAMLESDRILDFSGPTGADNWDDTCRLY